MTDNSQAVTTKPQNVLSLLAQHYNMSPSKFEDTLRATVLPKEATNEQLLMFLSVCAQYNLNPFTREIYGYPTVKGGIQAVVGVDGWAKLMNEHKKFNGIEFTEHHGNGKVTAITATIWRKDRQHPTVITEYMAECMRDTGPWKQWPVRMLRHKALKECARVAFGFAGITDPDDAERAFDQSPMRDVTPTISKASLGEKMREAAHRHKEPIEDIKANGNAAADASPQSAAEQAEGEDPPPDAGSEPQGEEQQPDPASPSALEEQDKRRLRQLHDGLAKTRSQARAVDTIDKWRKMVGPLGEAMASASDRIFRAHLARLTGESSPADSDAKVEQTLT